MGSSVSEHGHGQIWFNNWLYYSEWLRQNGPWSFHFICLGAALKSPDIKGQLKQIIQPRRQEFADLISSEIHKQLKPLQDELETKNKEIWALKITIMEQNAKPVRTAWAVW